MNWQAALAAFASLCAILFGQAAFARNRKTDERQDAKSSTTVFVQLCDISKGIDEIKTEQKEQRGMNMGIMTKLTEIEASTKQAHKRIDHIEEICENRRRDSGE